MKKPNRDQKFIERVFISNKVVPLPIQRQIEHDLNTDFFSEWLMRVKADFQDKNPWAQDQAKRNVLTNRATEKIIKNELLRHILITHTLMYFISKQQNPAPGNNDLLTKHITARTAEIITCLENIYNLFFNLPMPSTLKTQLTRLFTASTRDAFKHINNSQEIFLANAHRILLAQAYDNTLSIGQLRHKQQRMLSHFLYMLPSVFKVEKHRKEMKALLSNVENEYTDTTTIITKDKAGNYFFQMLMAAFFIITTAIIGLTVTPSLYSLASVGLILGLSIAVERYFEPDVREMMGRRVFNEIPQAALQDIKSIFHAHKQLFQQKMSADLTQQFGLQLNQDSLNRLLNLYQHTRKKPSHSSQHQGPELLFSYQPDIVANVLNTTGNIYKRLSKSAQKKPKKEAPTHSSTIASTSQSISPPITPPTKLTFELPPELADSGVLLLNKKETRCKGFFAFGDAAFEMRTPLETLAGPTHVGSWRAGQGKKRLKGVTNESAHEQQFEYKYPDKTRTLFSKVGNITVQDTKGETHSVPRWEPQRKGVKYG